MLRYSARLTFKRSEASAVFSEIVEYSKKFSIFRAIRTLQGLMKEEIERRRWPSLRPIQSVKHPGNY